MKKNAQVNSFEGLKSNKMPKKLKQTTKLGENSYVKLCFYK